MLTKDDEGGRGGQANADHWWRGGEGGVWKPPILADVICEHSLIGIIFQFSYVCLLYTLLMGKTWLNITKNWITSLQLDLKHIHKVKFCPSDNNLHKRCLWCLWSLEKRKKRQKDKKTKGQKDKRTKGQKDKRTKRQKDKKTKKRQNRFWSNISRNL